MIRVLCVRREDDISCFLDSPEGSYYSIGEKKLLENDMIVALSSRKCFIVKMSECSIDSFNYDFIMRPGFSLVELKIKTITLHGVPEEDVYRYAADNKELCLIFDEGIGDYLSFNGTLSQLESGREIFMETIYAGSTNSFASSAINNFKPNGPYINTSPWIEVGNSYNLRESVEKREPPVPKTLSDDIKELLRSSGTRKVAELLSRFVDVTEGYCRMCPVREDGFCGQPELDCVESIEKWLGEPVSVDDVMNGVFWKEFADK